MPLEIKPPIMADHKATDSASLVITRNSVKTPSGTLAINPRSISEMDHRRVLLTDPDAPKRESDSDLYEDIYRIMWGGAWSRIYVGGEHLPVVQRGKYSVEVLPETMGLLKAARKTVRPAPGRFPILRRVEDFWDLRTNTALIGELKTKQTRVMHSGSRVGYTEETSVCLTYDGQERRIFRDGTMLSIKVYDYVLHIDPQVAKVIRETRPDVFYPKRQVSRL